MISSILGPSILTEGYLSVITIAPCINIRKYFFIVCLLSIESKRDTTGFGLFSAIVFDSVEDDWRIKFNYFLRNE